MPHAPLRTRRCASAVVVLAGEGGHGTNDGAAGWEGGMSATAHAGLGAGLGGDLDARLIPAYTYGECS